jgi:hypothetical protein
VLLQYGFNGSGSRGRHAAPPQVLWTCYGRSLSLLFLEQVRECSGVQRYQAQ